MTPRLSAYLMMLLVSIIWGVAGPVIKFTLGEFPPLIFLSYRFAISSVVALIYFSLTKVSLRSPKEIPAIIFYSLGAVTFGLGLLFFGFDQTTSLSGSLLSATAPLAVVGAGTLFLGEHVTKIERWGIIVAFIGTILTIVGPLISGDGLAVGTLTGNLLVVASILVDTAAAILLKVILRNRVSPALLTHVSFLVGFFTIVPLTFYFHSWQEVLSTINRATLAGHAGVWYMALLSGTLAYSLRNRATKTIEVSEVAVFAYLYPLVAIPLSVYWLGERITLPFIIGSLIIALGVAIAEHKRRKRHRQRR